MDLALDLLASCADWEPPWPLRIVYRVDVLCASIFSVGTLLLLLLLLFGECWDRVNTADANRPDWSKTIRIVGDVWILS